MKVYLDYAATTPVKKEVLEAMRPYWYGKFGNASSIHSFGRDAKAAIDQAREKIAKFLNCETSEVIFTSGGTESDNLAIYGTVLYYLSKKIKPHIITSSIEHHAVLEIIKWLKKMNFIDVTYISVSKNGIVDVAKIKKAIKNNTVLISIMYANNEIGTVQPIRDIGKMIEKENSKFEIRNSKIIFHTDAVQAASYLNCDTKWLHVDLLTLSGHKIGAPKGIGVLYMKKDSPIQPIIYGGHHEYGKRAGTENVAGIVGLGKAVELLNFKFQISNVKIRNLRDYFIKQILKRIPDVKLNGDLDKRLPNNVNFSFKGVEGESILILLDQAGIAASSGSACTSATLEPSHVLLAMGLSHFDAHGSVRFTLGEETTKEELDYTVNHLQKIIARLRKIAPKIEKNV